MDPRVKEVTKREDYLRHEHGPIQSGQDEYAENYPNFHIGKYDHMGGLGKTVVLMPKK